MVKDGTFREDLFYRISVIPIELPALRERMEDIPELAAHFVEKFCAGTGRTLTIGEVTERPAGELRLAGKCSRAGTHYRTRSRPGNHRLDSTRTSAG